MSQIVEFIRPHCYHHMGVVDFARPDCAERQDRIFFKGLGHYNPDSHEPDCQVLRENPQSFTPIVREQVERPA